MYSGTVNSGISKSKVMDLFHKKGLQQGTYKGFDETNCTKNDAEFGLAFEAET